MGSWCVHETYASAVIAKGSRSRLPLPCTEMFPMGLSAWHDGAGPCIIFDLLTTLRYIARARKPLHQRLLAQTQCFTPLLNIIGTDITSDDERVSQVICVSVLRTLRVLCQDCRESRQVFRSAELTLRCNDDARHGAPYFNLISTHPAVRTSATACFSAPCAATWDPARPALHCSVLRWN